MKPEVITLIGTLSGVLIGGLTTALVTWIDKYYGEKKHKREVIVNVALENWKVLNKAALNISESTGKAMTMLPLDAFVLSTSRLLDTLMDKNVDLEKLKETYKEHKKIEEVLIKEIWQEKKE